MALDIERSLKLLIEAKKEKEKMKMEKKRERQLKKQLTKDNPNTYIQEDKLFDEISDEEMKKLKKSESSTIKKILKTCEDTDLIIIEAKNLYPNIKSASSKKAFSFQDTETLEAYRNIKFSYTDDELKSNFYKKITSFEFLNSAKIYLECIKNEKLKTFSSFYKKRKCISIIVNGKKMNSDDLTPKSGPEAIKIADYTAQIQGYDSKSHKEDIIARKNGFLNKTHKTNMELYRAVKYLRPLCENHKNKLGYECGTRDIVFTSIQDMFDKTNELREQGIYNFEDYPEYVKGIEYLKALQVDHVDGNSKNNSEDNLQVLCPYCHSRKTSENEDHLTEGAGKDRSKCRIQWTSKTDHNEDIRSYLRGEVDTISLLS